MPTTSLASCPSPPHPARPDRPDRPDRPGPTRQELTRTLGDIAERTREWLRNRRSPAGPGFSLCPGAFAPSELNATTGGVELWVMLGLPLSVPERRVWIDHLSAFQNPATGLVVDPTWRGRQLTEDAAQLTDGDSFFTMTTVAALEALGARLPFPVRYLADASVEDLESRVAWDWIAHSSYGVGDFGPLVRHNVRAGAAGAQDQWAWLNRMLADTQDPSGFWPRNPVQGPVGPLTPHINRAFHVLRASWNLSGRPIHHADRLVDACLAASGDADFYGWETGFACNDLDLAHVAYSAASWTNYRRDELGRWARHRLGLILAVEKPGGGFSFHHERAMAVHANLRMSPGGTEADTWGTLMYLGAIRMMAELGWPGIRVPWNFSRVHPVPGAAA